MSTATTEQRKPEDMLIENNKDENVLVEENNDDNGDVKQGENNGDVEEGKTNGGLKEDESDAGTKGSTMKVIGQNFARMTADPRDANYNMNHSNRGCCVIFNNRYFDANTGLSERTGTDQDRDRSSMLFKHLGFRVEVYDNKSVKETKEIIESIAFVKSYTDYHEKSDCFVFIFMSHGEDGLLYGRDGSFKMDFIFDSFTADQCPSLAAKPKMFFIQACRGEGFDAGTTLVRSNPRDETDSGTISYKIPNTADFLVAWSTVPGYFSWRNTTNGSWFLQSVYHIFSTQAMHEDVLSMMTNVNRHMILTFESNCPSSPSMHGKKQSATFISSLMRKIYLRPKF